MKTKNSILILVLLVLFANIILLSVSAGSLAWSIVPADTILNRGAELNVQFLATSDTPIEYSVSENDYFAIDSLGYLTNTTELPLGSFQIEVFAKDVTDTISKAYTITIIKARIDSGLVKIPVVLGWNELAFPFLPENKSLLNVLKNASFSQVKTQEADGSIKIWESGIDDAWNDLREIKFENKYLIKMKTNYPMVFYGYSDPRSYFYEEDATPWVDASSCNMTNDSITRSREVLARDDYKIQPDATLLEKKVFPIDCCTPFWVEGSGTCSGNTIFTAFYHDINSCYSQTHLSTDNNPPEPNVYGCSHICSDSLGCDYTECSDGIDNDGDGQVDFPADPECRNGYYGTNESNLWAWDARLDEGLEMYYNFNSPTELTKGIYNLSTISGSPAYNPTNCLIGSCLQFTSTATEVRVLNNWAASVSTITDWSLNFWISAIETNDKAILWDGSNYITFLPTNTFYWMGNWIASRPSLHYESPNWYMVTMTDNETGTYVWINGTLKAGPSTTTKPDTNYLDIGRVANPSFRGQMDEMGIWSRSLSASEITELYNSGLGLTYNEATSPSASPTTTKKSSSKDSSSNGMIVLGDNSNNQAQESNTPSQIISLDNNNSKETFLQIILEFFKELFD